MNEDSWLDAYWESRIGWDGPVPADSYDEPFDLDEWADEDDGQPSEYEEYTSQMESIGWSTWEDW